MGIPGEFYGLLRAGVFLVNFTGYMGYGHSW